MLLQLIIQSFHNLDRLQTASPDGFSLQVLRSLIQGSAKFSGQTHFQPAGYLVLVEERVTLRDVLEFVCNAISVRNTTI
jgi:hypothetical protein